jgi:hypothetical protein
MPNYTDSGSNASTSTSNCPKQTGETFKSCGRMTHPQSGTSSLPLPIAEYERQLKVPASFYQNPEFVRSVSNAIPGTRISVTPGQSIHRGHIVLSESRQSCFGRQTRTDRALVPLVEPKEHHDDLLVEEIYYQADSGDPTSVRLFVHGRSRHTGRYYDLPGFPSTAGWSAISEPVQKSKLPKWLLKGAE